MFPATRASPSPTGSSSPTLKSTSRPASSSFSSTGWWRIAGGSSTRVSWTSSSGARSFRGSARHFSSSVFPLTGTSFARDHRPCFQRSEGLSGSRLPRARDLCRPHSTLHRYRDDGTLTDIMLPRALVHVDEAACERAANVLRSSARDLCRPHSTLHRYRDDGTLTDIMLPRALVHVDEAACERAANVLRSSA